MTSGLRQKYTVALAALALAACTSKATPDMTPEESKRIGELTARMSPRCVGRYLVDLPQIFVLNSQSRTVIQGATIKVEPMTRSQFELRFRARKLEISALRIHGEVTPSLHDTHDLSQGAGAVFDRSRSGESEVLRSLELLGWKDQFTFTLVIDARDLRFARRTLEGDSRRTDVSEKLAHLLDIYARLHGRNDDEIPKEQGVCFANGFLRGAPTDEEWIDMYHHLDGVRDVYFAYHYLSDIGPEKTTLLQRGPAIEASLDQVNGKTLRKGSRKTNEIIFDEWLMMRESDPGVKDYHMTLEANSKAGNAAHPLLVIDFSSGVEHPGPQRTLEEEATKKPIQKSTLSEAESIALWDKVTATLRPRPGAF